MEYVQIEARIKKSLLPRFLLILSVILFARSFSLEWPIYQEKGFWVNEGWSFSEDRLVMYKDEYSSFVSYFFSEVLFPDHPSGNGADKLFYYGLISMVCSFTLGWRMNHSALTVTTFRIAGKASFGKIVDIPIQQISMVTLGTFNRLIIATPAGKESFWGIQNREDVYNVLMNTVLPKQNPSRTTDSNLAPKQTPIISKPATNTSAVPQHPIVSQNIVTPANPIVPQNTVAPTSPIVPKSTVVHQNNWTCHCGQTHEHYVSSCSCGLSKREVRNSK